MLIQRFQMNQSYRTLDNPKLDLLSHFCLVNMIHRDQGEKQRIETNIKLQITLNIE